MTTLDPITETPASDVALERYATFSAKAPSAEWLKPLRQRALARFLELGFPTTRLENWRNTNVSAIAKTQFELSEAARVVDETVAGANAIRRSAEGSRIVFIDGHYAESLSSVSKDDGVIVTSLATAVNEHRDLVEPRLGSAASFEGHAFAALNAAMLEDGAFVYIPDGVAVSGPIHLLFVSTRQEGPRIANVRNLIVAGENSQVKIIERYEGSSESSRLTLSGTEVLLGAASVVELYKVQQEPDDAFHISTLHVRHERDSRFTHSSISLGAAIARNDLFVELGGEGAGCVLDGLYIVEGSQHVDHHTEIDHAKPHCDSVELYKGVLDGRSRGVFDGRIVVRKDAQKTNSAQTNNNLILSELAIIDTKPQLEIYADDVKCTHGSTIGQLDEEAMFYLRSRGIDRNDARNLLIYAFASEVVGRIRVKALREELQGVLLERLPGDGSGAAL